MPNQPPRPLPAPRPTVSVPQAAKLLGIPKRTLYDYCQKGLIPHVKVVRRVLLLRKTVDAWIAAGHITTKYRGKAPLPQDNQPW